MLIKSKTTVTSHALFFLSLIFASKRHGQAESCLCCRFDSQLEPIVSGLILVSSGWKLGQRKLFQTIAVDIFDNDLKFITLLGNYNKTALKNYCYLFASKHFSFKTSC